MAVPVDLSKLSDVIKKGVYDKLVAKVNGIPLNNIDTSRFVLKTKNDTDKSELENKIPDTSGLITILKSLKVRVKYLILVI